MAKNLKVGEPAGQPGLPGLLGVRLWAKGKCTTLGGLRAYLGDVDDYEVMALVEDGRISWAIDVSSEGATVRELRFPLVCLRDLEKGEMKDYSSAEMAEYLWGGGALIKGRAFYRALNIKHSHFYDLVAERVIRLAKGSVQRRGPGGSAVVTRLDGVDFLQRRRVC